MKTLEVFYKDYNGPGRGARIKSVLKGALDGIPHYVVTDVREIKKGSPVLFCFDLDEYGMDESHVEVTRYVRSDEHALDGCVAGILVDGKGTLYTKSFARSLAFDINRAGAGLVGRPLVESVDGLKNFTIQAANKNMTLEEAYVSAVRDLAQRLTEDGAGISRYAAALGGTAAAGPVNDAAAETKPAAAVGGQAAQKIPAEPAGKPSILALHVSNRSTSNTLAIWKMISAHLEGFDIREISLRNGTLNDCAGCQYKTCLHFGEKGDCFYGGVMVSEVYPAVLAADAIVLLCPNYNDAVPANISSFINRLTALFVTRRFYDKAVFAVVVSGYSGGDLVAEQIISGMNMNKSFYLPPRFCLTETANKAGEALRIPNIDEDVKKFAGSIKAYFAQLKPYFD